MHAKIFNEQNRFGVSETVTGITISEVKQWARQVGMDGTTFDNCLDSLARQSLIRADMDDGTRAPSAARLRSSSTASKSWAPKATLFQETIDAELADLP